MWGKIVIFGIVACVGIVFTIWNIASSDSSNDEVNNSVRLNTNFRTENFGKIVF
jgi:hypothetical protein